jgi:hypothetical protein
MSARPDFDDRRSSPRFKTVASCFAVLASNPPVIGMIKNISSGGLCFDYVDDGSGTIEVDRMDLFVLDQPWQLKRLPVRTVSNQPVANNGDAREAAIRRCGVAFGNLTAFHNAGINDLITHHTQPPSAPSLIFSAWHGPHSSAVAVSSDAN